MTVSEKLLCYFSSFHASLVLGNDRVLAELGIHTWTTGRMTTAVVIEYGPRGRFEVTTKIEDTTHGLTLQGDLSGRGVRQGRAAIYSPSIGNFEFELDRSSSSGIIVLTTARGLHKVSISPILYEQFYLPKCFAQLFSTYNSDL